MEKKTFNKGDFVKYCAYNGDTKKVTFGIFEGVDLNPEYQYSKKYSLLLYYDSYQYVSNANRQPNGQMWSYQPVLDISTKNKPCEKTIDTLVEDTWWSLCTPEEKANAINILENYGYTWDDSLLALIDTETAEIVRQIFIPKIEYNGDTIKPMDNSFKNKLKAAVLKKNPKTPAYNYGGGYEDYYD